MDEAGPIINKTAVNPGTPRHPPPLVPLDRPRRLRGHVIDHPADALDPVDDAGRGAGEEAHVVGEKSAVMPSTEGHMLQSIRRN